MSLANISQFSRTEPTASSGIPYVGCPRCNATKCYSSPLLSVETFTQSAPSRISGPTAANTEVRSRCSASTGNQYCMHSVGHYSHCDMSHTVIASHDITSFDIINTCFVCKLTQTCSCTKKKNIAGRKSMLKFCSTKTTNHEGSCRCVV